MGLKLVAAAEVKIHEHSFSGMSNVTHAFISSVTTYFWQPKVRNLLSDLVILQVKRSSSDKEFFPRSFYYKSVNILKVTIIN